MTSNSLSASADKISESVAAFAILLFGLTVVLFLTELAYFRIAARFNIVDNPNFRSSHDQPVIRGGGILFFVGLVIWFFYEKGTLPWFMVAATLVAAVSFADDVKTTTPLQRFIFHLIAMLLVFYQLSLFAWPIWLIIVAIVVCIGTLNAFNFMDGINGITGINGLVTLGTFGYVNRYIVPFTDPSLIIVIAVAVLVFLFFNFRKRARCFAGDVGSVTLAFILVFLLLSVIYRTGNYSWALLFLVFGIDSVITIVYRLWKRENIFKPHRTHLYQYMTNEMKMSHLFVSVIYGIVQLAVNIIMINFFKEFDWVVVGFVVGFGGGYIIIRERVLKEILRGPQRHEDTKKFI
jgi:UDP-N-acetylmuramyl pentapeptide phosphotransferase/UDP-N-acetylglucosamine-1-phosphate transferase